MSIEPKSIGLFPICIETTSDAIGAPFFKMTLTVYPPGESVHGVGQITQTTSPPLDIHTKLEGTYGILVFGADVQNIITLTGYPIIDWPPHAGIGPVIPPNVKAKIRLNGEWGPEGTITYQYRTTLGGPWSDPIEQPCKVVPCFTQ